MTARGAKRLATLARVRDILERQALGRLAQAQRQCVDAESRLAARREDYAGRPSLQISTPEQLSGQRMLGMGAHDAVRAAEEACAVVEHRRAEMRDAWSRASIARKSVERLAERRAAQELAERVRTEVRELDELVLQMRSRT